MNKNAINPFPLQNLDNASLFAYPTACSIQFKIIYIKHIVERETKYH